MSFTNPDQEVIAEVLKSSSTIAVVGLSDQPHRTSYQVSEAMQKAGYKIIPVNPNISESLGEKAVSSLKEVEEDIDIINVFRRSEFLPEVAEEAKEKNAKAFWAQQGVFHPEADKILKNSNQTVIMDTCIKVAHAMMV
ncbi:CoA-binding protein [Salimicrobium halophilum]|uniref:Predicted CoA-binding protein n=1 Tax=Salimicrobium halophilum TaxID=86666 RepID=A0A1G8Q5D7_9BACI|nr:CoA-binding protein [Salimicrobium halophilum]SDI99675.1 Predicted CoA-binding protein [Salimicrobium halophilum]